MRAGLYLKMIWLMVKEEYRFHTQLTSKFTFFLFPTILITLGGASVIGLERAGISMMSLSMSIHFGIFMYGLVTGAFGFLGKEIIERRFGQVAFLFGIPSFMPVTYRETFTAFFLRDIFFYILYIILPMIAGQLIFIPLTHLPLVALLLMFFTTTACFALGVSIAFLIAMTYLRSSAWFYAMVVFLGAASIGLGGVRYAYPSLAEPLLHFSHPVVVSLTITAVFLSIGALITLLSSYLIVEKQEDKVSTYTEEYSSIRRYTSYFPAIFSTYAPLIAKEIIDIKRSRTLSKILFSFVLPLLILIGLTVLAERGLKVDLQFNTIFYGGMIGFFGVMIYSWLNNMDIPDIYQTLPVSVPYVIKGRLIMYHILNSVMGTFLVIIMGLVRGEYLMILFALPVMLFVSAYISLVTAYLTGLRTNTLLFDIRVALKFNLFAMLPLFSLTLLSMLIENSQVAGLGGLAGVCILLTVITYLLYRSIPHKWENTQFMV